MFRGLTTTVAALVLVACTAEPAEIRVKGPRDALESVNMVPKFAPFEKKGDTIKLRASAFGSNGAFMGPAKVRWSSSDPSVATVNQLGLVTVLSSGTAEITAKTEGYSKTLEAGLEISASIVGGIRKVSPEVDKAEVLDIPMGKEIQFKAEVLDDHGEVMPEAKIRWSTSNWAATVTPAGLVEGRAMGTVQITAENKKGDTVRWEAKVIDWAKK